MNRKTLYVITVILALILIAGLVFVFVMPKPQADVQQDAPAATDATGNEVATDAPSEPSNVPETVPSETQKPTQPQVVGILIPDPTEESVPEDTSLIPGMPEVSVPVEEEMTYEKYHSMSGDEQAAFINSFDSYEAFFQWYNAAEDKYKEDMIPIDGSTPIDLGGNP